MERVGFRNGARRVVVETDAPHLAALAAGLLPEYLDPATHTDPISGAGIRIEVKAEREWTTLVPPDGPPQQCADQDLPALLEFVVARTLQPDPGAAAWLHASGVQVGDEALLVVGPAGAGKSSLALQMLRTGHPLLSDDFIGVHPDGRVEGFRRYLKLDVDTLAELGIDPAGSPHWSADADEAWLDPATWAGWCRAPLRPRWIVVLAPTRHRDALEPLAPHVVLEHLMRARPAGAGEGSLSALADLVEATEAVHLEARSHSAALVALRELLARTAGTRVSRPAG